MKKDIAVFFFVVTSCLAAMTVSAQDEQDENSSQNYLDMQWKKVVTKMPDAWYGSDEAKQAAENVLLYQFDNGGWPKNKKFQRPLSEAEKTEVLKGKSGIGSTFDNGATINEMIFLAKVFAKINDSRYKTAFEKGFNYILRAQYSNGGWPQFFPFRQAVDYASHITYNDNAMINVMTLLNDIVNKKALFDSMHISDEMRAKAKESFDRGVSCILKTQIKVNGKSTVWCAQHDEFTFAATKARAYELPSFSGSESVFIVGLLMNIDKPSPQIKEAVADAIKWFEAHKIKGIRLDTEIDSEGGKNIIVVEDATAPALWARFYDLKTEKPFFCDRDGVKKNTLAEIGYERRNGYRWYNDSPQKLLDKYPQWATKVGLRSEK